MIASATLQTSEQRDQIIMDHLPQVRLIARRIHDRCPENVVLEDLVSAGTLGLIAAIDRYDSTQGVKLKTYAEYKIRGAILDSLRSMDWAPREQRRRAKLVEIAFSMLEQQLQRVPTEAEVAQELGIRVADYHDWVVDIRGVNVGSLEVSNTTSDESRDILQYVSSDQENLPSRQLEKSELERLVAVAVERMPHMERTVLSLYFHEELTLREISKVVGLHESRISQLKAQGLLRLRSHLQKCWPAKGEAQRASASA